MSAQLANRSMIHGKSSAGCCRERCGDVGGHSTPMTSLGGLCLESLSGKGLESAFLEEIGMVQKHPFSGNTRDLSADPDRSRVGAGLRESLAAVLGLQFRENRVYPRSSSQ